MIFSFSFAQKNFWEKTTPDNSHLLQRTQRKTIPSKFDVFNLDLQGFKNELLTAPKRETSNAISTVILNFPNSEGELESFRIYEASVMHPDLQAQFPDIKSYVGVGIEDKTAMIRFSTTLFGVHAMIFSGKREVNYIDTYTNDLNQYIVYSRKNIQSNSDFNCLVEDDAIEEVVDGIHFSPRNANSVQSNTGIFRTYRLAMACTIEYAQYHWQAAGLTNATPEATRKAAVLAAMNVSMTRINGIYERDMSLTMQLVPNNLDVIFITSDNFNNNNAGTLIGQSQTVIDGIIGSANYDIGHTVSTGGGGLAQLNSPCTASKARGITGSPAPVGDPFDIDYVAHEMGHQFGATHTFNNSCGGNRSNGTAVEPGSGSTIMAYAGICAPNVQNNSDAHFHAVSLAQMDNFVAGAGNCSVNIENNNDAPVIQPIQNYTIPKSTAFVLEGNATDANGNALTYCWEQTDTGISTQAPIATDPINGPRFRSRIPSTSPNRYLPIMSSILTGSTSNTWEVVPSIGKPMNFALVVRDNATPNGGQTARTDMMVTTVDNAGPFVVTSPNTNVSWVAGTNQNVTWDVSGTTGNGVNTPYVDIYLSTNNGLTFPVLLASQVPNDGLEVITVPNSVGTTNRIMVKGHKNIFLDVSNTNFTITAPTSTMAIAFNGVEGEQNKSICQGSNVIYDLAYQTFAGFINNTTFSATGNPAGTTVAFVPSSATLAGTIQMQITTETSTPVGLYTIVVTATSGATTKTVNMYLDVVSANFSTLTLNTPAEAAIVQPSSVVFAWAADPNASQYTIQIASDDLFLSIVDQAIVTTNGYTATNLPNATTLYWRVAPGNSSCYGNYSSSSSFSTTFCNSTSSTNVPIVIPSAGTPTVNSTLTIPMEEDVLIQKVTATVNISHSWVNDLVVTLISPTGTQIQLMSQECTSSDNFQNVSATFDDSGIAVVCATVPNPALSGTLLPQQPLTGFNGQNSQGVWTLRVQDLFNQDGGSINSWSLNICSANPPASIEETTGLGFSLYPNPTKGNFSIRLDQLVSDEVEVEVYDMRGRVIYAQSFVNNGTFNQEIQLANPQSGVYLVRVTDGNQKEVKRLIIE